MQKNAGFQWRALLVFIINGMGLLFCAPAILLLVSVCAASVFDPGSLNSGQVKLMFSTLWITGLIALLLTPAALLSFLRLIGKSVPNWRIPRPFRAASLGLILWLLALLAGFFISTRQVQLGWLLLPPLELLVIGLPLWWWIEFGVRGLKPASALRNWSLFGTAANVTPLAAFGLQMALFGGLFVGLVIWITSQPDLASQMTRMAQRIANSQMDSEIVLRILRPLLLKPAVILAGGSLVAGLIPLIEEMVKSLPVWGFARKGFTPSEGLAAGLICGSAFGLIESLLSMASITSAEWGVLVLGRLGTGLLHTVTTGLIGWALAEAWQSRRYIQLGLAYLLMVVLHGLWNAFAVFITLPQLVGGAAQDGLESILVRMGIIAPVVLGLLMLVLFLILARANRLARRQSAGQVIV